MNIVRRKSGGNWRLVPTSMHVQEANDGVLFARHINMQLTPTITFRGIDPSTALEAEIRARIDKLETYYRRSWAVTCLWSSRNAIMRPATATTCASTYRAGRRNRRERTKRVCMPLTRTSTSRRRQNRTRPIPNGSTRSWLSARRSTSHGAGSRTMLDGNAAR